MNTPELMTKNAFAKEMGFSHVYVKKLEEMGRLRMVEVVGRAYPKVDVAASKKLIAETADPTREDVGQRWDKYRDAQNSQKTPLEDDESEAQEQPKGMTFAQAKTAKMIADAKISELALLEKSGALVSAEDVRRFAFDASNIIRERLERMPHQIAPELAAEANEGNIRQILTDYIDDTLHQAARDLDKSLNTH